MRHDFWDKYSDLDSPMHRLDARVKLLGALVLLLAILLVPVGRSFEFYLYLALLCVLVWASRVPVGYVLRKSLLLSLLAFAVAMLLPFFKPGRPLWQFQIVIPIQVTYEGVLAWSNVLSKAYLAILTMVLLSATTRFSDLLAGLQSLKCPRVFILLLSFVYRYVFVLVDEAEKMMMAREARRFGLRGWRNIHSLIQMIGVLFLRAFERAEAIYHAMLARGFTGEVRTLERHKVDVAQVLVLLIFATVIGIIKTIGMMRHV
jgi:cobalt/nickel transport system permease protein